MKMYCRICGAREEDKPKWYDGKWVELYPTKGLALCKPCAIETPDKVSKREFIKVYFEGDDTVSGNIIREFYDDYLASTCKSVQEYIDATRSESA